MHFLNLYCVYIQVEVKGADEQQAHLTRKRSEGKPVNILPSKF